MSQRIRYEVFVYGTLKQGKGNNRLLGDSEFIGVGSTVAKFSLKTNGGFPYAISRTVVPENIAMETRSIFGEIYRVTPEVLSRLDMLEGVNCDHYYRSRTWVSTKSGLQIYPYMYFATQSTAEGAMKMMNCKINERECFEW